VLVKHVHTLLNCLEKSQYTHVANVDFVKRLPILTRSDLRKIKINPKAVVCRTSGSTGEAVSVEKSDLDRIWHLATNIRAYRWAGWDPTKNVAIIKSGIETVDCDSWGLPTIIEPKQGRVFKTGHRPMKELQNWLEEKNPHYLNCYPSVRDNLDLSRISNYIGWGGTGEMGGTVYSSEECGTIAIMCPDNNNYYHVMENQIVEVDDDGGILITTLTNKHIKRYKHGDVIELGTCTCGRTLQAISKIKGRIRNMYVMQNGDKKWPLFGSRTFYEKYGIKRFQVTQKAINKLVIKILSDCAVDEESLITEMRSLLEESIDVSIKYVEQFDEVKFEEFTCEL
jgi:phenylacetate-coenzyme A ligase PaaK-like adenylate-forming protein